MWCDDIRAKQQQSKALTKKMESTLSKKYEIFLLCMLIFGGLAFW